VEVLGFTLNPQPNYNLITEKKNEADSKKADGAILKNSEVLAVVELKGTNTTDLNTVTGQAFGYKNNQKNCKYVLISNFEKLRFYIDNAIDFEEFDLFTLTAERFEILYLCLQANNLLTDLPDKIKQASTVKEENVTKQLYKDYSDFKRKLFTDTVQLNPQYDKLILFKKSQKLLDRILFILFAEDRGLLQANTIQTILDEFENLKKLDAYSPLYDRFKKHFTYLNEGFKNEKYEVFGYNGGLFAPDEVLDNILISDNLLLNYTPSLAKYDYETDVDVNILGHIFEHSLNDIEEIQAELEGKEIDKTKTKRKKDGVFYTPKYITKYIVENTVGALCTEKRNEYGIVADNYTPDKRKAKKKELLHSLDSYQNWLLEITIVDPACGSGAFLNQALDFLIQEHKSIDELRAQLLGHGFVLPDHEISILENNIFGVDLNEESVEIARLSLWLRTARKGRKLNSLNNNIKCGNSLIDDKAIAGDKAFNWQNEFPQIFKRGGFDIVIGNPPYGAKVGKEDLNYFVENYKNGGLNKGFADTYISFYILGISELLNKNGLLGYIAPNTWRLVSGGNDFRKFITSDKFSIQKIIQHTEKVFVDATVDVDTMIIKNSSAIGIINIIIGNLNKHYFENEIKQSFLHKQDYFNLSLTENIYRLKNKIENNSFLIKDLFDIKNGVKPYEVGKGKPPQTKEVLDSKPYTSETKIDETFTPLIGGSSFNKYKLLWNNDYWIKYGEWLAAPRDKSIFDAKEKLIFRQTSDSIIGMYIIDNFVMRNNTHILLSKTENDMNLKYALSVLNSKLINYYYQLINPEKGEALAEVKAFHLENLPIKQISLSDQQPFIEKAETMLQKNKELQTIKTNLVKLLQSRYSSININTKLSNWNELNFKDFCKELEKQKIKLSISEQAELMQYFEAEQTKANIIQQTITQTDKEIDQMVYKLYELTDEEIKIVENN
jgi:type I restriction-modification system DNA methylase subunit